LNILARFACPVLEKMVNRIFPFNGLRHLGGSLMMAGVLNYVKGIYILEHSSMEAIVMGVATFEVRTGTIGMVHA
jgi:hypothetical protein